MYPEEITNPIREEFEGTGIKELLSSDEVVKFVEKKGTKLLFINSVCGCASGNARPVFIDSLKHSNAPMESATIFAGVDREAIDTFKEYLIDDTQYTSPAFYILRDSHIEYRLLRNDIESFDKEQVEEYLHSLMDRFFKDKIDESVEIKHPLNQFIISRDEADEIYKQGEAVFIDCRTPEEREENNPYEKSLLLTSSLVQEIFDTYEKDKNIIFYCARGRRSMDATLYFKQNGFSNLKSLDGGVD